MKTKTMKIIGIACAAVGFGISIIQKQVDDRKLEELIDEKVQQKINETQQQE